MSAVERIDKYILERRLGQGAMGEVWLAHDPDLDIRVAVKTLLPALMLRAPLDG